MLQNIRKSIELASAVFAVLLVGVITMNYIINLATQCLRLLITNPLDFARYFVIVVFVFYGLYHANARLLRIETKKQS